MANEIYDIRLKRDTYENLTNYNPIINEGQNVLEYKDTLNIGSASMKVGQSSTSKYNDLPYVLGDKSDITFAQTQSENYQTIPDGITHMDYYSRVRNSLAYLKKNSITLSEAQKLISVTLKADSWTGDTAPFSQTVANDEVKEYMNPLLVSMLEDGATSARQEEYNAAFALVNSGTGITNDGSVTFKVYEKPSIDITVGLVRMY